jgi:hypothetical protein
MDSLTWLRYYANRIFQFLQVKNHEKSFENDLAFVDLARWANCDHFVPDCSGTRLHRTQNALLGYALSR